MPRTFHLLTRRVVRRACALELCLRGRRHSDGYRSVQQTHCRCPYVRGETSTRGRVPVYSGLSGARYPGVSGVVRMCRDGVNPVGGLVMVQVKRIDVWIVGAVLMAAVCAPGAGVAVPVAEGATPSGAGLVVGPLVAVPDAALVAATNFRVIELTESTVGVAWDVDARTTVRVRRTTGNQPAATVNDGVRVAVSGATARVTGLEPGSAHTMSLFTRVGRVWQGPVAISVGTVAPVGSNTATYVTTTNARFLDAAQIVSATLDPTGVSMRLTGAAPAVGTVLGLPVTTDLPSGYLGVISGVETDGLVRLTPASFGEAFDYWNVDIDQFPADTPIAQAAPRTGAGLAKPSCSGDGSPEIDFGDPIPTLEGSFHGQVVSPGLPIPGTSPGVRLRGQITLKMDLNGRIKTDGTATCTVEFQKVTRLIRLPGMPVPLTLTAEPRLEATVVDSKINIANLGFTSNATAAFDTEFTLEGVTKSEGSFNVDFQPREPQAEGEGTLSLSLVSDMTIGFGEAVGLKVSSEAPKGTVTIKKPVNQGRSLLRQGRARRQSQSRGVCLGLESRHQGLPHL